MTKSFCLLVSLLTFASQPLYAQKLLGNIGLGIGYDVFIRDKRILPYSVKWPARPGMGGMFGIKYLPENGFEIFLNANVGTVYIQIPAPGYGKSRTYFKQFHSNISIGSGPQIKTESRGTFIPYVQLGAGFYSDWGEQYNNPTNITVQKRMGLPVSDTWTLICGAGIDWQIGKRHLSGLNLQASFTPMNIYEVTPEYEVSTPAGLYDIKLQGRLLQFMLSYNTHFSIKKWNRI